MFSKLNDREQKLYRKGYSTIHREITKGYAFVVLVRAPLTVHYLLQYKGQHLRAQDIQISPKLKRGNTQATPLWRRQYEPFTEETESDFTWWFNERRSIERIVQGTERIVLRDIAKQRAELDQRGRECLLKRYFAPVSGWISIQDLADEARRLEFLGELRHD